MTCPRLSQAKAVSAVRSLNDGACRIGRGLGPSIGWVGLGWVGSKFALHVMGWVGLGGIGWVALGCAVSQLYCSERLIQSDVKITV